MGRRWVGLCPFHAEKTAVVLRQRRGGPLLLLRLPGLGRRHHLRAQHRAPRLRRRRASSWPSEPGSPSARRRRQGPARPRRPQGAARRSWSRPSPCTTSALLSRPGRRPRPATTCARGATTARRVRQFRLGWAPDDGQGARAGRSGRPRTCSSRRAWLIKGQHGLQDAFRGRVIFPIFDPSGKAIALGGRILPGDGGAGPGPSTRTPPRRRSTRSGGPSTRSTGRSRTSSQTGEVVVCEGYTDVIGFFNAGVPRAVATCGTALTEEHFRLLGNFAKRIVLAFDADAAGQSAAARFYEWEKRHELEVAVAALPPAATRPTWRCASRRRCRWRWRTRGPSCPSGSKGRSPRASSRPPRAGRAPPRRRSPWWPSTRTSSCATSSSSRSRTARGWRQNASGPAWRRS